jgi:acyl-CoA dehydrogenase
MYAEHELFIETVKKLSATHFAPHLHKWQKEGKFPNDVFVQLGKDGYLGLMISEKFGGIGGDYLLAAAWCEAFGELCDVGLTTAVNMHSLVITPAIDKHGTEAAKERWLPAAVRGEAIGAYAFTEPGAGSDLANIRMKAERVGSKWRLEGAKTFITNGARADFILVLARNDFNAAHKGFTTFVIDTKAPGFKVNRTLDKVGWHSSDTAELTLNGVEVDDSCVLGKVGDGWIQASNNLNWERLMLTLTSLAGAKRCFADTVKYTKDRPAFGKPIRILPGVSAQLQKLQEMLFTNEALTHRALKDFLSGKKCRAIVAAAKRKVCEEAILIADKCLQLHGGYGYTTEFSPERWWRDLRLMTIGGGTSEIMGNIVEKEIL